MRIRINEMDKQRSFGCNCLHNNIVVESLVVVLTLVSGLAITGENLLAFNIITVPQYARPTSNVTSGNDSDNYLRTVITENVSVKNVLVAVFHFTSLGISGLFFLEVSLKVCTLQKRYVLNPWQIFDAAVVLATLVLELVVFLAFFRNQALHSMTYFVLLRLWRLPMLCNIQAQTVQEDGESDIEFYRTGRLKAEERCQTLESKLSQRDDTIRKLEKLLHSLTDSTQSDLVVNDDHIKKNGHLPNMIHKVNDTYDARYEPPSSATPDRTSYSSLLPSEQSRKTFLNEMETQFMSVSETKDPAVLSKLKTCTSNTVFDKEIAKVCTETCQDQIIKFSNNSSDVVQYDSNDFDCEDGAVKCTAENNSHLHSENLCPSSTSSTRQSQILLRSRKRRSSASEILDYGSKSSQDMGILSSENTTNSLSCQNLDLENDKLFTEDICDKSYRDNSNIASKRTDRRASITSGSVSDVISVTADEKKRERKKLRRFISCPEYVFTQRMSITSDESRLIEDGHTCEDPVVYNNLAVDFGGNAFLQVLAEYDGIKTYRNEDGVPMTSL